jgi:hypothetical protein
MADKKMPCHLETLPSELIHSILVYMDSLRDLGNFIITACFMNRHFEGGKRRIMFRVLQNELGTVLADARFLYLFPYSDPGSTPHQQIVYWDHIHTMTAVYRDMLRIGEEVTSIPSVEELTQLCRTLRKMNFLASAYFAAQQRSLGGDSQATSSLSRVEKLRIVRAFYRRQIVCNAWAPTRRNPRWAKRDVAAIANTSNHEGVQLGLFSAFEAWELQQIDHVDRFVIWQCKALCLAREGTTAQISEAKFGEIFSHVECLVHYMCERPGITDTTLHTPESLFKLDSREVEKTSVYDQFIARYSLLCLQFHWQYYRFDLFPDPVRDRPEGEQQDNNSKATIDFTGDMVSLPPFGWIDATDGHYVNWFGAAFGHASRWVPVSDSPESYSLRSHYVDLWRDAGFTFWDQSRAEALKKFGKLESFRTGWAMH